MAPSTIRKAIGALKDQISIRLAKVSGKLAPELDVAIVKATSHDDEPPEEKHIREILNLISYSRGYVQACIATISRRLGKTRDWIVALKSLMLVHHLLVDGHPSFHQELLCSTPRLLNMHDFLDEDHDSSSSDHSAFIRSYAFYLDQRLDSISSEGNGEERRPGTPLREMKTEKVLERMNERQQLLDRFLACRPTGLANNSRMILVALSQILRESFQIYQDICEILALLLDHFIDMDYTYCVKSYEAYASAAKQIDELAVFYAWCKDTGVARSMEYPDLQRITTKPLETMEEFMKDGDRLRKSSPKRREELAAVLPDDGTVQDVNSIVALPKTEKSPQADLVDLSDVAVTADSQGNKLALDFFSTGAANGTWKAFPDWELALVETASNIGKQKDTFGGGFDPLFLNGMYDQRAKVSEWKTTMPILALPAPGGTVRAIKQDPFAASLSIPPASYVQMADIDRKQLILLQEQQMWQQYASHGMQGKDSITMLNTAYYYGNSAMPYGMQTTAGYYYPHM